MLQVLAMQKNLYSAPVISPKASNEDAFIPPLFLKDHGQINSSHT